MSRPTPLDRIRLRGSVQEAHSRLCELTARNPKTKIGPNVVCETIPRTRWSLFWGDIPISTLHFLTPTKVVISSHLASLGSSVGMVARARTFSPASTWAPHRASRRVWWWDPDRNHLPFVHQGVFIQTSCDPRGSQILAVGPSRSQILVDHRAMSHTGVSLALIEDLANHPSMERTEWTQSPFFNQRIVIDPAAAATPATSPMSPSRPTDVAVLYAPQVFDPGLVIPVGGLGSEVTDPGAP